jgi:Pyruvate/2-oxoacid:ferredoxin oxidoreductase delta subunit
MAKRAIIEIDEESCDGCGLCASGCPEGAIQIIDGKARLVGESLCDGLGACLGECPKGAIATVEREAEPYDERKVMEGILSKGMKVVSAHLEHLRHHGQDTYAAQAEAFLRERGIDAPRAEARAHQGCPGSSQRRFTRASPGGHAQDDAPSALTHWPIQLHLLNPNAPQFDGADLLVAADCTAFSLGSFHSTLLSGKSLAIACPKLDGGRDVYVDKLAALIGRARSVTVAIMEVPCCSGLLRIALEARERSGRTAAITAITLGIEGGVKAIRTM